MKALILNSGLGHRMGVLTSEHPKCMTEISATETILSRQLKQIVENGITEVVMTTGYYDDVLVNYCHSLELPLHYVFIKNPDYDKTNYIYSIYCAREALRDENILLMHGDLVFENSVFSDVISSKTSCMTVSSTVPLPEKDFKAVVRDGMVQKVGVETFSDAVAAQALYRLNAEDWKLWLDEICRFCEAGQRECYAENALNKLEGRCHIAALDVYNALCNEVDTPEDLAVVTEKLREIATRTVYLCFSTDTLHSGHLKLIHRASRLGSVIVGVMSDAAVCSYKRVPLVPCAERMSLFENLKDVSRVVEQKTLSYADNLRKLKPTYVVHGDDWCVGFQRPIRDEVTSVLSEYGGQLVEYSYTKGPNYDEMERRARDRFSMPDYRRGLLKRLIDIKGCVSVMEAHSGITGLLVEKTCVMKDGETRQIDAMWVSSLCDSTAKGKPDIELVDMTSRFRTIDDIMEVTTKPIIFDGDTGGMTEHFVYTVRSLERMGVSAVIIEDKTGLKKNSLFGTEVKQTQDSIENFSAKIKAGKAAQKSEDFMIIARVESLILEQGMEDALERAFAFVKAGADGIMIHSRKKDPSEIFEFVERFRQVDSKTPVVVVPTSFNSVTEAEFKARGVNVVIYANQLTRSGFPAMQKTVRTILENQRAFEADQMCMSIKDIITLIPEE